MHARGAGTRLRGAAALLVAASALALGAVPAAADEPRYDVPPGYVRCAGAVAWNGFFKWASARRVTCRQVQRFMRAYARAAERGPMPHRVRRFRCRIRYWRNADGDVYASRHDCRRRRVAIRFYGMA